MLTSFKDQPPHDVYHDGYRGSLEIRSKLAWRLGNAPCGNVRDIHMSILGGPRLSRHSEHSDTPMTVSSALDIMTKSIVALWDRDCHLLRCTDFDFTQEALPSSAWRKYPSPLLHVSSASDKLIRMLQRRRLRTAHRPSTSRRLLPKTRRLVRANVSTPSMEGVHAEEKTSSDI